MSSELERLASASALHKAMEDGDVTPLPHGCRLFDVGPGWAIRAIAEDPDVARAETLLSLETALQDSEKKVIFIPSGSLITDADIEKLCRRNATVKTLFREVGN